MMVHVFVNALLKFFSINKKYRLREILFETVFCTFSWHQMTNSDEIIMLRRETNMFSKVIWRLFHEIKTQFTIKWTWGCYKGILSEWEPAICGFGWEIYSYFDFSKFQTPVAQIIWQFLAMLPLVCSVIGHRWRQNAVRTSKWHKRRSWVCYWFSYHIWRPLWSIAVQTNRNVEFICFLWQKSKKF